MRLRFKFPYLIRVVGLLILCAQFFIATGCAAIVKGLSEQVKVSTSPSGREVFYKGQNVRDGQYVSIDKQMNAPVIDVGNGATASLRYNPDLWLIGDAVLCIPFFFPGLIAFAVDFGTGAWRDYEDLQVIAVPDAPGPAPAPAQPKEATQTPEPVKPTPPKPTPPKKKSTPQPVEPEPSPIQP